MKRFFYPLITLCACYASCLFADSPYQNNCNDPCETTCFEAPCCPDWSLEFRVAAFIPTNSRVRDIYSNAWPDYQLQIGKRFWNDWQFFGEVSGFQKQGHSSLSDKTTLTIVPISLGVKYFFNLCSNFDAYVGGGVVYSFFRTKDNSPYVHEHVSKGQFGGVIKTGLIYTFCNCWFVDVFADYYIQRFSYRGVSCDPYVTRQTANLNAFKVGGGIGYNF